MDPATESLKHDANQTLERLREELKTIRTGKANPSLMENLVVETYGGQSKLKLQELATLGSEGANFIVITPFDPSTSGDIEKAILKSPLGFTPAVQGNRIVIKIPPLTEEQRTKFVKLANQMVEEKRGVIRNLRDNARKNVKARLEKKELTEDDKYRIEKEIDTITQKVTDAMLELRQHKEADIMQV